jgi:putative transcriptional regulator
VILHQARQRALRERLVADHAAGVLSPALALLVETRAALSEEAALELAAAETVASDFLEQETPAPLAPDALERVFARIAVAEDAECARPAALRGDWRDDLAALPAPVRDLALDALARTGWKFSGRGIRSLVLDVAGDAKAEILRIEPGAAAPMHSHAGQEFTLVLTGAFSDARGVYGVGDIAYADPKVTHRPTGEAGAVCYSLAVTDAPLVFRGALGALQRLWRH